MSSHDARSLRQSKRMSVTALYLSMSAKEKDLEISDDLSKGEDQTVLVAVWDRLTPNSPEISARIEIKNIRPIQEELCAREGCSVP
jgi:Ras GTPase-activating-like protein IQGAP2/3